LSLGIFGGGGDSEVKTSFGSSTEDFSFMGLDIGVLGKYPFTISEKLSVFPLLGITYRVALSVKSGGEKSDDPGDNSALWFKFGGGLDYALTEKLYLRGSLLYGIRLANKFEKDLEDSYKALGSGLGMDVSTKTLRGHGLEVKIAVGYKF
jgi:opacity protein-like surface antigen